MSDGDVLLEFLLREVAEIVMGKMSIVVLSLYKNEKIYYRVLHEEELRPVMETKDIKEALQALLDQYK